MKLMIKLYRLFFLIFGILYCVSCQNEISEKTNKIDHRPAIEPDYSEVTIPPNIAPMNFIIKEDGRSFMVMASSGSDKYKIKIKSSDGIIRFPERSWRKLTETNKNGNIKIEVYSSTDNGIMNEYEPFYFNVSNEPIDPYLAYRLIHPGYYSWSKLKIEQRSLETFRKESILDNEILEKNCINCHSFNQYNPDRFMVHIRGSKGGTYFVEDGKITRTNLKIESMPGSATYPSWHPGGRYLAFSSNQVRQGFYAEAKKSIEVYDLVSSLILYDREKNEILNIPEQDTTEYFLTFPSWSPDGKYLYFCRAEYRYKDNRPGLEDFENTHYNLARRSFDPDSRSFGDTEIVFDADRINKSASFPRVSPDGKYLVFTLADYGTFPIWHQEADLYLLNLQNGEYKRMELNSDETDSYHTWSSNGKWLVFSSKRSDGRTTRPYFAYIDSSGNTGKPFILPQKDPTFYHRMMESFNIPEFITGRIRTGPRNFAAATKQEPVQSDPGNPLDSLPQWKKDQANVKTNENDRPIHQ
jgi:hypothetical protein